MVSLQTTPTMLDAQANTNLSPAQTYWLNAVQPRIALLQTGFYHQGPESANALQEAIDSELTAMYTAIAAVKSLRNTQTAIRRLPPEVLTHIFWFCSLQESPYRRSYRSKEETSELWKLWNPGWMKVTYVCHFWREAALQDPRLWGANIACHLPLRWFEETLERSKLAPASIRLESLYDRDLLPFTSEVNGLLSKHLHHVRHLALEGGYYRDMSPLMGALSRGRAPALEAFEFKQGVREGVGMFPEEVFAHYAPRLRRVRLTNFVLPATFCPDAVSRLEHLDIDLSSGDKFSDGFHRSDKCLPYNTLFASLQQMHGLRTMRLKAALPPCGADVFAGREGTLSLPLLEKLEVDDGLSELIRLFESLRIPATTRIQLRSNHSAGAKRCIEDAHVLAAQLRRHLQAAPTPCPALYFSCHASSHFISIGIQLWSYVSAKADYKDAVIIVDINGGLKPRSEQTGTDVVRQFYRALGVGAVTWLRCSLQPVDEWSHEDSVDFFTCFSALEVLEVYGSTGRAVAKLLASPTSGKKLSAKTALLQHLRVLVLDRFDFGPPPPRSRKAKPGKCEYVYLLDAFRKRKVALGGVPKLTVSSCIIKQEWVDELREGIGEVEWIQRQV